MAKKFEYQFEWDTAKARQNLKEHRVSFERAATVFLDPLALSEVDEEHSLGEQRWLTLGWIELAHCLSSRTPTAKKPIQVLEFA